MSGATSIPSTGPAGDENSHLCGKIMTFSCAARPWHPTFLAVTIGRSVGRSGADTIKGIRICSSYVSLILSSPMHFRSIIDPPTKRVLSTTVLPMVERCQTCTLNRRRMALSLLASIRLPGGLRGSIKILNIFKMQGSSK